MAATPSPTPSPTASPTTTDTPTATPQPTALPPLPSIGPAPSGNWTGIHWLDVPVTNATPGAFSSIAGWSGGYLRFSDIVATASDGQNYEVIATAHSIDGLRWEPGQDLRPTADIGIASFSVVEGPAGLLAMAWPDGYTGGIPTVQAMWSSTDGVQWRPLDLARAFGSDARVEQISAGSTGYVAKGESTTPDAWQPAVWTSSDAIVWRKVNLDGPAFKNSLISDAAAFAGGYVIAGAVLVPDGGCGGPATTTPSLWWSPDGATWSRDAVTGTTSATGTGSNAFMSVCRITDRALLATEWADQNGAVTTAMWTSTDGRTWKPLAGSFISGSVITDGRHGVVVQAPSSGNVTILAFTDHLGLVTLAQTGDLPQEWEPYSVALGPVGLVIASHDGSQIWVGVPTA